MSDISYRAKLLGILILRILNAAVILILTPLMVITSFRLFYSQNITKRLLIKENNIYKKRIFG